MKFLRYHPFSPNMKIVLFSLINNNSLSKYCVPRQREQVPFGMPAGNVKLMHALFPTLGHRNSNNNLYSLITNFRIFIVK